jgi:hypothetical protein
MIASTVLHLSLLSDLLSRACGSFAGLVARAGWTP